MRHSPLLTHETTSPYQMTPSSVSLPMTTTELTAMQLQPPGFSPNPQAQMWNVPMNQQQQPNSPSDATQMGYVQMPPQPGDLEFNLNRVDTFPTYSQAGTSYDFHHASAPANTPIADIASPPLYYNTHRLYLPHMGLASPLSTRTSQSDLAPRTSLFDHGTSFGTQEGGSVFPQQNTWPPDDEENRPRGTDPLGSRNGSTAKSLKKRALGSVTARFRVNWLSVRLNQMFLKAV